MRPYRALFALALAGCSVAGSNGSIPGIPRLAALGTHDVADHRKAVGATLRVHIPRRTKRHRPSYVSGNTGSFTVIVQRVTASPWPSPQPAQVLVVATPAPCTPSAGGGVNCQFTVKAFVGENTFSFASYESPSGTGPPLSTFSSGIENVGANPTPLAFTLEGVVADVVLGVSSPESTAAPITQAIPIASPTMVPLIVTPRDASGAHILTDTFASPLALHVSPSTAGVTLAFTPQCAGETGPFSGPAIALACANDLATVNAVYDGTIARNAAGTILDSVTITASPQPANGAPRPAIVALASAIRSYTLAASGVRGVDLAAGPNGSFYFVGGSPLVLGSFDPANPAAPPVTAALGISPSALFVDSFDNIWVGDQTNDALACYTSIASAPVSVPILNATGHQLQPVSIAQDASGNIWYTAVDGSGPNGDAGFITDGAGCGGLPASSQASVRLGAGFFFPAGGAANQTSVASGSGIWATANGQGPFDAVVYSPYATSAGTLTPAHDFGANYFMQGSASDAGFNLFVALGVITNGFTSQVAEVQAVPGGGASTVATMPPGTTPFGVAAYSGTGGSAQEIAVTIGGSESQNGLVLFDPRDPAPAPLFIPLSAYGCFQVVFARNGDPWASCLSLTGAMQIFNPVLTSTWGLPATSSFAVTSFPSTTALAIAETAQSDSSPYTVIANTNPAVVATAAPWAGYTHQIPITLESAGSATLTIADKTGRTQTIAITSGLQPLLRRTGRGARDAAANPGGHGREIPLR